MHSYSQDLRDRVLWALERGESPTAIARRLEVSRVWVYQVRDRKQATGSRSSYPIGGHRRSRIADMEVTLRAWIDRQPDLALAEICDRLAERGVAIKIGALWHQLNKWGLTFKKNPARQRAGTRGRAANAPDMDRSSARDERRKARIHR
jgi:transposase